VGPRGARRPVRAAGNLRRGARRPRLACELDPAAGPRPGSCDRFHPRPHRAPHRREPDRARGRVRVRGPAVRPTGQRRARRARAVVLLSRPAVLRSDRHPIAAARRRRERHRDRLALGVAGAGPPCVGPRADRPRHDRSCRRFARCHHDRRQLARAFGPLVARSAPQRRRRSRRAHRRPDRSRRLGPTGLRRSRLGRGGRARPASRGRSRGSPTARTSRTSVRSWPPLRSSPCAAAWRGAPCA
jgi:hypothetical protein